MLSANQIASFFKMEYLKKEVNFEVYLWRAGKHESFQQVDGVTLGVYSQACPKYPSKSAVSDHTHLTCA